MLIFIYSEGLFSIEVEGKGGEDVPPQEYLQTVSQQLQGKSLGLLIR